MSTREALQSIPRPVRPVALPGGATVHVRDLSLAELRRIETMAAADDGESNTRYTLLLCAAALCEPDGMPCFDSPVFGVELVEGLTLGQIEAIAKAAVPDKAEAKNA